MNQEIDDEERDLLASLDREEWQPAPDLAAELAHYRAYAAATLQRDPSVSIRLPPTDLEKLRQAAQAAGVSHEIFIARIVHQFVAGELVERT